MEKLGDGGVSGVADEKNDLVVRIGRLGVRRAGIVFQIIVMREEDSWHGTVEGIGAATGSQFSLIPAQNATGNWIKVVQRVPVRISLDPRELQAHPLRVGLSMKARVEVE